MSPDQVHNRASIVGAEAPTLKMPDPWNFRRRLDLAGGPRRHMARLSFARGDRAICECLCRQLFCGRVVVLLTADFAVVFLRCLE